MNLLARYGNRCVRSTLVPKNVSNLGSFSFFSTIEQPEASKVAKKPKSKPVKLETPKATLESEQEVVEAPKVAQSSPEQIDSKFLDKETQIKKYIAYANIKNLFVESDGVKSNINDRYKSLINSFKSILVETRAPATSSKSLSIETRYKLLETSFREIIVEAKMKQVNTGSESKPIATSDSQEEVQITDNVEGVKTIELKPKLDEFGRAYGTGRRKTSVARVWVKEGSGQFTVNGKPLSSFFDQFHRDICLEPFLQTNSSGTYDVYSTVKGGGITGMIHT